mmetsp:Transcript_3896/g.7440  ORF Transcript_3896/g.7440 Transcript_3896/m.7440 type:complete len:286 (-) Transcript_3896:485-1342(-)
MGADPATYGRRCVNTSFGEYRVATMSESASSSSPSRAFVYRILFFSSLGSSSSLGCGSSTAMGSPPSDGSVVVSSEREGFCSCSSCPLVELDACASFAAEAAGGAGWFPLVCSSSFEGCCNCRSRLRRFRVIGSASGKHQKMSCHLVGKLQLFVASATILSVGKAASMVPNPACLSSTPAAMIPWVVSHRSVRECARTLALVRMSARVSGRIPSVFFGSFFKNAAHTCLALAGRIWNLVRYLLRLRLRYFAFEYFVLASKVVEFDTTASTSCLPDSPFFISRISF